MLIIIIIIIIIIRAFHVSRKDTGFSRFASKMFGQQDMSNHVSRIAFTMLYNAQENRRKKLSAVSQTLVYSYTSSFPCVGNILTVKALWSSRYILAFDLSMQLCARGGARNSPTEGLELPTRGLK